MKQGQTATIEVKIDFENGTSVLDDFSQHALFLYTSCDSFTRVAQFVSDALDPDLDGGLTWGTLTVDSANYTLTCTVSKAQTEAIAVALGENKIIRGEVVLKDGATVEKIQADIEIAAAVHSVSAGVI